MERRSRAHSKKPHLADAWPTSVYTRGMTPHSQNCDVCRWTLSFPRETYFSFRSGRAFTFASFLFSSGVLSVRHGRSCLWFTDTQTCSLRKGLNALVSDRQDLLIKARASIPIPADIPLGGGMAPMIVASLQESTISFGYGSAFAMLSEGEVPKASTLLPAMDHTSLSKTTALLFVIGRGDLSRPASPDSYTIGT